jgi:hypothetical protein
LGYYCSSSGKASGVPSVRVGGKLPSRLKRNSEKYGSRPRSMAAFVFPMTTQAHPRHCYGDALGDTSGQRLIIQSRRVNGVADARRATPSSKCTIWLHLTAVRACRRNTSARLRSSYGDVARVTFGGRRRQEFGAVIGASYAAVDQESKGHSCRRREVLKCPINLCESSAPRQQR